MTADYLAWLIIFKNLIQVKNLKYLLIKLNFINSTNIFEE